MDIFVGGKKRKVSRKRLSKVLEELKINPEEFLIVRNGELLTLDTRLAEGDLLELLPVVSGG
jgi:sulfur carrier protein ThiS